MKSFLVSQKKLRQGSQMCAHNEICGFMQTCISSYIGSQEKVSSKKKVVENGVTWCNFQTPTLKKLFRQKISYIS